MKVIKAIFKMIRVYQWTKSGFVILPFIFSDHLPPVISNPFSEQSIHILLKLVYAFFAFSFIASTIYVINDFKDRQLDRLDPRKKHRPIASGTISPSLAILTAIVLFTLAIFLGFLSGKVIFVILAYFVLNLFYTYLGKRIILLDVFIIALGFVLRVVAGAYSIEVEASPWLLSCTFSLSLFLGFFKRYYEVQTSPSEEMIGGHYKPESLRNFINISAAVSIMNYAVYTLEGSHSDAHLYLTIPFVVMGIFRFYTLLESPDLQDGNPSDVLVSDWFLVINIILWAVLSGALILYFHPG